MLERIICDIFCSIQLVHIQFILFIQQFITKASPNIKENIIHHAHNYFNILFHTNYIGWKIRLVNTLSLRDEGLRHWTVLIDSVINGKKRKKEKSLEQIRDLSILTLNEKLSAIGQLNFKYIFSWFLLKKTINKITLVVCLTSCILREVWK